MSRPAKLRIDTSSAWNALSRAPMVRFTIPVLLGIVLGRMADPPLILTGSIFIASSIVAIYFIYSSTSYSSRWKRGAAFAIWLLAFGLAWGTFRSPQLVPRTIAHHEGEQGPWLIRAITLNRVTDTQLRADADVEAYFNGKEWVPRSGTIMFTALRTAGDPAPRVGDRMFVNAPLKRIARIPDPGGFNRQLWAAARGIEMELFAPWHVWRTVDHTTSWIDRFSVLRQKIGSWVEASDLGPRDRALVKALVLGQRDELEGEQRTAFARSGTIHVLAVSGMHVGLIYVVIAFLLKGFGGRPAMRVFKGILTLLALWMYAGITGGSPSVLRATVMFSFITLADMTARRTDGLNSVFAAMFLLLLWDPTMIGIIGFQLSFLAVISIIIFYKPLEELWTPGNWLMRRIWSLAVLSISAQMLTAPVSLFYFNAFPLWFLPANIIVVTAVVFSVWGSIALIVLHKVPIIAYIITEGLSLLLTIISETTAFFASLPLAYPIFRVDMIMVFCLYAIVLSLAALWLWHWRSMRWIFSGAVVVLLMAWGWNAHTVNRSNTFTLYDEREGVLASIANGREMVMLADHERVTADPFTERKITQHQKAVGLRKVELLPPDSLMDPDLYHATGTVAANGRWSSLKFDVLFLTEANWRNIESFVGRLDAVIIHDMERVPEELLETAAQKAERLVLAGKSSWRTREWVAEWCAQRTIHFHDVFAQGAFVLER